MCMCVYVCVCIVMYGCLPASFQHPSSILTASLSFQPHSSFLTASSQSLPSIIPASSINMFWYTCAVIINVFLYMCALAIIHGWYVCIYNIYVCIHHQSSLITCMHWSSICMTALSHTCTVFLCVCWLPRSHVGAVSGDKNDAYPGCSAENQKKDTSNTHKNTNKTNNTPHGNHTHVLHFQPQCKASLNHQR